MANQQAFWSVLTGSLLWAGSALADPSAADRATARSLAGEGYQALQTKDYATAMDRFSRADALVHAPTLMIDWARALVGMGKLVEAQERYEQILREGIDAKAPRSWQRAFNDAGAELAQLKPRLAWVTITVSGSKDAQVTIDGVAVPAAAVGVRRAVNPGARELAASAPGFLAQKMDLELVEGGDGTASFTLEPDPNARPEKATPRRAAGPPARVEARDPTLVYLALAVGGAGLIVGGVTGTMALTKRSELAKACDQQGRCQSKDRATVHQYDTRGIASGIGFGVGVAGLGTGLALWLLQKDSTPSRRDEGLTVRPYVGFASAGAVGSF